MPQAVTRRTLLKTLGAAAGAAVATRDGASAQTQGQPPPGTPPSTITTPPRDFGPNASPNTYSDPDFVSLDPKFGSLVLGNTPIKRLWTGSLWSEGPAWSAQGRFLVWS